MLLEIRHVTQYLYASPVRESVMEVWMQPQKSSRQRLVSFDVELDPAAQLFSYADSFGNPVYHFDVPQPHDRLTITAHAAVETQPPPPLPEELDTGEWDRLRGDHVRGEYYDFLQPHGFARDSEALAAFAREKDLDLLRSHDPLTAVRMLCRTLAESFGYESGVTRADSPIDDMLASGKGVSQDFAHVMIALCRGWGVPARYVSGYLLTDRRKGDRSESDATHAWVEVFLPSLRWVGLDPSNKCEATERHVACAVGRDYSDVPPSRGVYKGDSEHKLAVGVSVRKARAAVSEPEFLRNRGPRPGPQRAVSAHQPRLHQMQQQGE